MNARIGLTFFFFFKESKGEIIIAADIRHSEGQTGFRCIDKEGRGV